jgi:hypothetical protein
LRPRCTAMRIGVLREQPAGEAILHHVLHCCERGGLLRGGRDRFGRRYELTPGGRARLRAERRYRLAMVRALLRAASTSAAR